MTERTQFHDKEDQRAHGRPAVSPSLRQWFSNLDFTSAPPRELKKPLTLSPDTARWERGPDLSLFKSLQVIPVGNRGGVQLL